MAEEISYTTPSKTSRYKNVKVFMDETNIYFNPVGYVTIPAHEDDQFFNVTLKYKDNLPLIAHKFYKDSKLWWVIAKANNISDPLNVADGTILRIPATASLYGVGGLLGNG